MSYNHFGVVGAGAWGTACAQALARAGREVTLWAREDELVRALNGERRNPTYLPGVEVHEGIRATSGLSELGECDAILSVVPAQHTRGVLEAMRPHIGDGTPVVLCSKGIELGTRAFMSEVLGDALPGAVPAVLAGPSFAVDVASGSGKKGPKS